MNENRRLGPLQWIGLIAAIIVLASMFPQFRALVAWVYDHMVGRDNLGPDGEPAPGVLVRGILVVATGIIVFHGTIFFINYTNLGKRLAFLIVGTALFGFLSVVGLLYSLFAPRGLRPAEITGLNAFQLRILPASLSLASLILFGMFLVALDRHESGNREPEDPAEE